MMKSRSSVNARYMAFALAALACAGADETPMEPDPGPPPPGEMLTGTVIAADSFVVPATFQNFTVNPYPSAGALANTLPSTTGQWLVLSVVDQSRPGFVCTGGVFDTDCASIVVFENQAEASVSVALRSGRTSWFLQSNFVMEPSPPPG